MKILSMTPKTFLVWLAINTMIGSIISFFIYMGQGGSFLQIFIVSQVITQTIAFPTAFTGYWMSAQTGIFSGRLFSLAVTLSVTTAAVFFAIVLSRFIPSEKQAFSLSSPWVILIPSLILSAALTAASISVETLRAGKAELQKGLDALTKKNAASAADGLAVRTEGVIRYVRFDDIVYLSSSGRSSVIHTRDGDYEVFQLLGDIEQKLSGPFLRIHKQFIVNTSRIVSLKYYTGGRYNLYLNDEDENILPVGKSYLPSVKQYLKA